MDGYDLWSEASREPEADAAALRAATAAASLAGLWPFLSAAQTPAEHEHRLAVAAERIEVIAGQSGLCPGEVEDLARRQYALLAEARLHVLAGSSNPFAKSDDDDDNSDDDDKKDKDSDDDDPDSDDSDDDSKDKDDDSDDEDDDQDKDDDSDSDDSDGDDKDKPPWLKGSSRRHAAYRWPGQLRVHMAARHKMIGSALQALDDDNLRRLHESTPHTHQAARGAAGSAPAGARPDKPRTAYSEGVNPLGWLESAGGGAGGAEVPLHHDTGFTDSGEAEIPTGQLRGPDPQVTGWIDPQRDNNGENDQGQVDPEAHLSSRRTAAVLAAERVQSGPDQGAGSSARQPALAGDRSRTPEGREFQSQERPDQGPDQGEPGIARPDLIPGRPLTTRPHQGPGGGPAAPPAPPPVSVVGIPVPMPGDPSQPGGQQPGTPGQSSSPPGSDEEGASITAAGVIHRYNPQLPAAECLRIGRKMASRHFAARHTAISSQYDDDPQGPAGPAQSGGGDNSHGVGGEEEGEGGAAGEAAEVLPELAL
jgi:hypothetical protein